MAVRGKNDEFSFLGDVYLDRKYNLKFDLKNIVFNLESPISERGVPAKNKINLKQSKSYLKETFKEFPLAVSLANNHIMDFGDVAFEDTLNFLKKNNIGYFGAGTRNNNYNNPLVINTFTGKVAFLGYCCNTTNPSNESNKGYRCAELDEQAVLNDIHDVKNLCDKIILFLHWGEEEIRYPTPKDMKLAHLFIDNGTDLVIGHHAHVVQYYEIYKGKYIYYGLGNFIFPNFIVRSYWDSKNRSKTIKKINNKKNNTGAVVLTDSVIKSTRSFLTIFDKVEVNKSNVSIKNYEFPKVDINNYESFYYKQKRRKILIDKVIRFLLDPRVPTFDGLKELFNLIFTMSVIKK